ncbi:MAG: hypothetical protein KF713_08920 [Turneriella sp.]|nr:hypothetical protein [Turneriella sp.]
MESTVPPAAEELPVPADETAELLLDGVRHTLPVKLDCKTGLLGLGFRKTAMDNPGIFIHNADLAATGEVTIKTGAAWSLDLDDAVTWGTTAAGCKGTVVENTATKFELKVNSCDLERQFGTGSAKASFRLRCTKDT